MRNNVYSDIMLIQGYAITCIWKKNENFQNFMYNIYDKLWGDDITNSLIWIFIRTGQEMFSEKIWNFKMSQLPYFLSDFHHFCTNLWGNFYSFFWNYVNSGLDFPFNTFSYTCWSINWLPYHAFWIWNCSRAGILPETAMFWQQLHWKIVSSTSLHTVEFLEEPNFW